VVVGGHGLGQSFRSCTVVVVVSRVRCCWVRLYSCFLGSSDLKKAFGSWSSFLLNYSIFHDLNANKYVNIKLHLIFKTIFKVSVANLDPLCNTVCYHDRIVKSLKNG